MADLGSGTGMLTRWLLERGNRVIGVEPDPGMREVAAAALARFGRLLTLVAGTAEHTSLDGESATLISAGNAFHYFDPEAARAEARRILRPGGRVLIVRHDHASSPNAFMRAYEDFIARAPDSAASHFHARERLSRAFQSFFEGAKLHERDLGDRTVGLTWEMLRGRFLSTSLAPREDDERRAPLLRELADLHRRFETDGEVSFQLRWRYAWARLE